MTIRSQQDLEIELSKLASFENPSWELEQYATPAHIAAEWIWHMALNGEVAGKSILDAASGPGILGIGLLLMGAKKVYFVDKDESAMNICKENYKQILDQYEVGDAIFLTHDISLFDGDVEIVVQNPPFGTKEKHIDKKFLQKAFEAARIIYTMHKSSTRGFVEAICKDFNFSITNHWSYKFPIKATFEHHTKPVKSVDVGLWRMEKD